MVKPQIAQTIEDYIVQLASSGKLKRVINDDQLKEIAGVDSGEEAGIHNKEDMKHG